MTVKRRRKGPLENTIILGNLRYKPHLNTFLAVSDTRILQNYGP